MLPPPANDRTLLQFGGADPADTRADAAAQQLAAIRAEQRREWQAGRRILTEAYLDRFADLAGNAAAVVDLAVGEYQLRSELGDNPSALEFVQRFPQQADALRRRFAAQGALTDKTFAETLDIPAAPTAPAANGPSTAATTDPATVRRARPGPARPTVPGYEILGELGRGAMGVVYRARQKALGREVALKMVLSGQFAGPHELERFRTEAVRLAKLQHPNIVQIYEVGEFDGRPYFAMEYVPGGSLAKLLEKKPLAPRPAAELAVTLARAMQHAHERGIIHRDLKPANIMLAADGAPKIMDFGLAKGGGSVGDTASYAILGTPSYMAPEQAGGGSRDVGPAADIYALGSILYEALAGRPPFRAATVLDTIQLVTETDPVPPGDLTVNLPRDVETITLKCLQKEPAKRYTTAADLADDLQRFLDVQPILARPVPAWEKAWKWAKRRPAWAALIGTVIVGTAGLIAAGVWFNSRLRDERDIAVANATLAEQRFQLNREAVDRYFTEVSEGDLLDEPGLQPLREKLLKLAKDYYARFVEERRNDPAVRADLARSLSRLARITSDLKEPREAIDLHLQALPIFHELAAAQPDDPAPQADVAATWYELSKLYRQTNQTDAAGAACATAVGQWAVLANAHAAEPKYRAELARSYISQSNLDFMLGRLGPARTACDQALAIRRKLSADYPKGEIIGRDLATAWDNLANILAVARELPESNAARREASDQFRKLVAANPYRSLYRNDLARTQFNLGTTLLRTGEPQPAADALREAAAQWDRLHSLHPAVREYHVNLGNALFALAQAEWGTGKQAEADDTLAKSRVVRTDLANQFAAVPEYAIELARCDAEAGDHSQQRKQYVAAADAFRQAAERIAPLVERYKTVPRYRADLARYGLNLGKSLGMAGQSEPARAAIAQARELWAGLRDDATLGSESQVQTLDCLHALGDLDLRAGDPKKALETFERCVRDGELLAKRIPPPPGVQARLRDAWWGKAEALSALADFPDALAAWDQTITLADPGQLVFLKLYRLTTLARTSEYERALIEVDPLAVQARASGEALFQTARVYALAAKKAAADAKLPQGDRDRRSSETAERAVENLRLAQSKGYFAAPAERDAMAQNIDFDYLRKRPDFQKLLSDLNASAPLKP
jgi:predicted Ser/Thr protein kinase